VKRAGRILLRCLAAVVIGVVFALWLFFLMPGWS